MYNSDGFRHSLRAGEDQNCTPARLSLGGHYVHSGDADLSYADTYSYLVINGIQLHK